MLLCLYVSINPLVNTSFRVGTHSLCSTSRAVDTARLHGRQAMLTGTSSHFPWIRGRLDKSFSGASKSRPKNNVSVHDSRRQGPWTRVVCTDPCRLTWRIRYNCHNVSRRPARMVAAHADCLRVTGDRTASRDRPFRSYCDLCRQEIYRRRRPSRSRSVLVDC